MRSIKKRTEPSCVANLRREVEQGRSPGWNPQDCKEPMQKQLVAEQEGLCAYCMNRIKPRGYRRVEGGAKPNGGMKIEHWIPRSDPSPAGSTGRTRGEENMYVWKNLLGVCGGETQSDAGWVQHCDDSRGNAPLQVHPVADEGIRPEAAFEFSSKTPDGVPDDAGPGIWLHARQTAYEQDIQLLNLNAPTLALARYQARQAIRTKLQLAEKRARSREVAKKELLTATLPGPFGLPPFAPIIEAYLREKLERWT